MKKKTIENTPPKETKKMGWWITVQDVKDTIVLNIWCNRILQCRHCFCLSNQEYATLTGNKWTVEKIESALGIKRDDYYYSTTTAQRIIDVRYKMTNTDKDHLLARLEPLRKRYRHNGKNGLLTLYTISDAESEYLSDRREITEYNRIKRVNDMMARIPRLPYEIKEWINQRELGGMDFMTKKQGETYVCSKCGGESELGNIRRADGKMPLHKDMVVCPECGTAVQIVKREKGMQIKTHFCIAQPIDDEISVMRHFTAYIECVAAKKAIGITEDVRLILFKNPGHRECDIYYEQHTHSEWIPDGGLHCRGCFDNKHNRANKTEYPGYLYDDGIEEAFRDTAYEPWSRLFVQLAAAGKKLDYNRMMIAYDNKNHIKLIEMLFRGRFYKLLEEESQKFSIWGTRDGYNGELNLYGSSIEDVFGIRDRQLINRIRDKNGGENIVEWMRWSDQHGQKVSDKALNWLIKNKITTYKLKLMMNHFTIEQAMNYIERQRQESYIGSSAAKVISQYDDYFNMCMKLKKNTSDEMVYRPRELKRRHDEAVRMIEEQQAQIVADEYSKKYKEAEKVLGEIKEKFEYSGKEFFIMVPSKIVDIVMEGRLLHHCAGSTDRYFDRIKQHETYICFCRRKAEPDVPFYTIEVEPGGTIRQHRGMFDEEPDIEKIKPFLKEWQKEIKKRMSKKDHELAAASKVKREENIEELRAKNNTRVLDGLMEDFMEAM